MGERPGVEDVPRPRGVNREPTEGKVSMNAHTRRDSHPFEQVCAQASRGQWCWNLFCTTCGHHRFRRAFDELARGRRPDDPGWDLEGPVPEPDCPFPYPWERRLQAACRGADLSRIAADCRFPDWLGYLGLVLAHTGSAERSDRTLTTAWAPQLLAMVPEASEAHARLRALIDDPAQRLTLDDLELVEADLGA